MKRMVLAAILLLGGVGPVWAEAADAPIDVLAFSNGALIERSSPSYGGAWEPLRLIDEDPHTGWANPAGNKPPFEVVVSLAEQSRITRVRFDTANVEQPDRGVRNIEVHVSDQSATAGFTRVLAVQLKPAEDGQNFDLPVPAVGRWVKLVLLSNHGSGEYTELMNASAFGTQLTTTPLPDVSGTYQSSAYGNFHLSQTGAQLNGCYEHKEGLVQGGLEAHLMRLTWSESDHGRGPVVMVQNRDGRGFQGLWRHEGSDETWNEDWVLKKISNQIGFCPHWKPNGGQGGLIASQLAQEGRIRLYGINFDVDSDRLRADAKPTLDQLAAALKANAAWKITVEGHTDSSSTPAHNLDLSQRRAGAVKTYLAAGGIDAGRITTAGFGEQRPVAPNDTALGRAQNRRVEVAK